MAEKTVEMTLLFDFFGDLLSERQREYFDLYYNDDLSLSEIADMKGISRQGVRDVLSRAQSSLEEYESKTGVVARFMELRGSIARLSGTADRLVAAASTQKEMELASQLSSGLRALEI